jgi:hypothetical protein
LDERHVMAVAQGPLDDAIDSYKSAAFPTDIGEIIRGEGVGFSENSSSPSSKEYSSDKECSSSSEDRSYEYASKETSTFSEEHSFKELSFIEHSSNLLSPFMPSSPSRKEHSPKEYSSNSLEPFIASSSSSCSLLNHTHNPDLSSSNNPDPPPPFNHILNPNLSPDPPKSPLLRLRSNSNHTASTGSPLRKPNLSPYTSTNTNLSPYNSTKPNLSPNARSHSTSTNANVNTLSFPHCYKIPVLSLLSESNKFKFKKTHQNINIKSIKNIIEIQNLLNSQEKDLKSVEICCEPCSSCFSCCII